MASGLPNGLSAPSLRALASIGVFDLSALTKFTKTEVSALHGMGPKGIRTLETALLEVGLTFKA